MSKEEQALKRKEQILSTALDLFISKGYYGTSTRQISQKAGISSGLMFHYFSDKDTLYCELIKMGVIKMSVASLENIENPDVFLYNMISYIFQQLEQNMFFAKMFVFIDQAQHTEGIPKKGKELLESVNILKQISDIITIGQKQGLFKCADSELLSSALLCAVQGIAQEKVRMPEKSLPPADWIMDIIRKK